MKMWENWNFCTFLMVMYGAATEKNILAVPQKVKQELPYGPATPLLGIYPGTLTDICAQMFMAALFTR